jgi:hypothetical protein
VRLVVVSSASCLLVTLVIAGGLFRAAFPAARYSGDIRILDPEGVRVRENVPSYFNVSATRRSRDVSTRSVTIELAPERSAVIEIACRSRDVPHLIGLGEFDGVTEVTREHGESWLIKRLAVVEGPGEEVVSFTWELDPDLRSWNSSWSVALPREGRELLRLAVRSRAGGIGGSGSRVEPFMVRRRAWTIGYFEPSHIPGVQTPRVHILVRSVPTPKERDAPPAKS